jgi:hypothetical protein
MSGFPTNEEFEGDAEHARHGTANDADRASAVKSGSTNPS